MRNGRCRESVWLVSRRGEPEPAGRSRDGSHPAIPPARAACPSDSWPYGLPVRMKTGVGSSPPQALTQSIFEIASPQWLLRARRLLLFFCPAHLVQCRCPCRYVQLVVKRKPHCPPKGIGKCADSNLPVKPNGSSPFTASSRIFPAPTPLAESEESSTFAFAILRHLADSVSGLRPFHDNGPVRTKTTFPAPS